MKTKYTNFQEIEEFTRNPNYRINVGWKYLQEQLNAWNERHELELDPE